MGNLYSTAGNRTHRFLLQDTCPVSHTGRTVRLFFGCLSVYIVPVWELYPYYNSILSTCQLFFIFFVPFL